MDPRDRLRPLPAGAACTACGAAIPPSRIRILAHRDDVAFVELACPTCGSDALGLLIAGADTGGEPVLDVTADGAGAGHMAGSPMARPISALEAVRLTDHLAAWDGDLVGWLEAIGRGAARETPGWPADR
jgi:hypothetical protein